MITVEWIERDQWNTPDAHGPMPAGIERFDEARLDLKTTHYAMADGVEYRFEPITRSVFEYRKNQPCGAGCRCAARVIFREDITPPVTTTETGASL